MEGSMEFLKKNIDIPYDPAIPLPGTYPKEIKSAYQRDPYMFIFM
jgi:hypothetical protein